MTWVWKMTIFYWMILVARTSRYCFKIVPLVFIILVSISGCEKTISPVEKLNGQTMGTYWQVSIASTLDNRQRQQLQKDIEKKLWLVNQQMSTYIADSELSKINRNLTTQFITISPELHKVLSKALMISEQSGGAYDVTVEPLVKLWGFGNKKIKHAPGKEEVAAALMKVGYHKLHLDTEKIRKENPETTIDLSSIAKGYGVDEIAELLEQAGYYNYLVDIGGEVRSNGKKYNKYWTIAIETPEINTYGNSAESILKLKSSPLAVATSGNYRNFIDYEGIHAVHTINPKTGYPEESDLLSASVIAEDCMTADAYATTLMVLGKNAFSFAERQKIAALLIYAGKEPHTFTIKRTTAFIKQFGEN